MTPEEQRKMQLRQVAEQRMKNESSTLRQVNKKANTDAEMDGQRMNKISKPILGGGKSTMDKRKSMNDMNGQKAVEFQKKTMQQDMNNAGQKNMAGDRMMERKNRQRKEAMDAYKMGSSNRRDMV